MSPRYLLEHRMFQWVLGQLTILCYRSRFFVLLNMCEVQLRNYPRVVAGAAVYEAEEAVHHVQCVDKCQHFVLEEEVPISSAIRIQF